MINKLDLDFIKEWEFIEEEEELFKEENFELRKIKESVEEMLFIFVKLCWFDSILDDSDMEVVDLYRVIFLK